jgi:hypothetical protein
MNGGDSAPGRARPGRDGARVAPPRRRARIWPGIAAGILVVAVLAAGIGADLRHRSRSWILTAPPTAAGLRPDHNPADQISFASAVAKFRSSVTSLPAYRHLTSTVSAVYALGSAQAIGFVGFNGIFSEQATLKTTSRLAVTQVNPGPHGGTAECGDASSGTICDWSTATTVGVLLIAPTSRAGHAEPIRAADKLMIRLRDAVEHPAHGTH